MHVLSIVKILIYFLIYDKMKLVLGGGMSRLTVYQSLKTAVVRNAFPHYGFDDYQATILFDSWEQFHPFDKFLDSIDTLDCKLNIYAEKVAGSSEGVAVTVDDQIQHLGYMQSRLDMGLKLKQWECLLSNILRTGAKIYNYNYRIFTLDFDEYEFQVFYHYFQKNKSKYISDGMTYYISYPPMKINELDMVVFHVEFSN